MLPECLKWYTCPHCGQNAKVIEPSVGCSDRCFYRCACGRSFEVRQKEDGSRHPAVGQ
jgi:hypothetical protein